jgi:hypothetical protein
MKKKVNFVADNSVINSSNQQQDSQIIGIIIDLKLVIDQLDIDENDCTCHNKKEMGNL